MGRPLYTNNAATYLAFGITNTATTMQVSANAGSLFPNPTGGDYFYVSLISLSGPIIEIVKCTARSGDIFTIERGQEGTSPLYWNMGDNVQLRITAAGMNYIAGSAVQTTEEEVQTATQGQTVFTLATISYTPETNNIAVFVNGSKQVSGANYSESSVNTITFNSGLNAGDIVEFLVGVSVASGTLYATDIRYNEGGTGAVTRTVESKLQESVSVKDFGAKGDGTTDDTAAIQNAANAVGYGGKLYLPEGRYFVSSTITLRGATKLYGDGPNSTVIYRTGNYGNTIVCGSSADTSEPAREFECYGILFQHSTQRVSGQMTLPNLATSGAHLCLYGAQNATIDNCWFWRLPYQIQFNGGTLVTVNNCQFQGTWDPQTPALQEGIVQIENIVNSIYGNPTTHVYTGNKFFGDKLTRNITYNPSTGPVTVNAVDTIGSQYGILCYGLEDFVCANNYFGGQSVAQIAVKNYTNGSVIDWRIANNFFDGISLGEAILFAPDVANLISLGVIIEGNMFVDNFHSIFVVQNSVSNNPSVYNLDISNNIMIAGRATPMYLNGADGFTVDGNKVTNYNVYNLSSGDLAYAAAILSTATDQKGLITNNVIGGGSNVLQNNTSVNFCYFGISFTETQAISVQNNTYLGIRQGSNFYVGTAITENQYELNAAGNYQMTQSDEVFSARKTVGQATVVNLPLYPVLGRESLVIDGRGDAATNNITIATGDGTSINGSSTATINTNYGFKKFRFNGSYWNIVG